MRSLTFLPLILLPSLLLAGPEHAPPPKPLAIVHVTVIDATGAAAQPELTVVITGHRISALGKTIAELTSGSDAAMRQRILEELMSEISKFEAEYASAPGSDMRH